MLEKVFYKNRFKFLTFLEQKYSIRKPTKSPAKFTIHFVIEVT